MNSSFSSASHWNKLQEVGKLPAHMVVHAMYWAAFTQTAHPAASVGVLVGWHPSFREVGRDMHSTGRCIALEYRCRGRHVLAVWYISQRTRIWT